MIDSFITYESAQGGPCSPSYFPKNFDDMLHFTFPDTDPETYNLIPSQQTPPEAIPESMKKEFAFDIFSSHSTYSTNPSVKHSPEYVASPNDQLEDEDQYIKSNKNSGVMKKGIRKQYEPILDNNMVFRYEEDPVEYRKARKRIQNRESATRVRNRKKTHVEELEDEMDIIKKERAELKVQNASLVAENNMLKQQITFLERIVSRSGPEDMVDNENSFPDHRTEISESMINIMNKTAQSDSILKFNDTSDEDYDSQQPSCKYTRAAPTHTFKKHVALLGVFTLLLCVYGLLPRTEPLTVQLFSKNYFGRTSTHTLAVALNPTSDGMLEGQGNANSVGGGSILAWSIEIIALISYIVYMVYVVIAYRRHTMKKTNPVLVL